jgi:hypothetical protein
MQLRSNDKTQAPATNAKRGHSADSSKQPKRAKLAIGKTVRRNLMHLTDEELDRVMISLHRFQTEGRVQYRQLLGMHGGGGGTSSKDHEEILGAKMKNDLHDHYNNEFPDNYWWPEPVPNAPYPVEYDKPDPFFVHVLLALGASVYCMASRSVGRI